MEGRLVRLPDRRVRRRRRDVFEIARPPASRAPTTGRRGSTGPAAPAISWASRTPPTRATAWSIADYQNSYYGRLAAKLLSGARRAAGAAGSRTTRRAASSTAVVPTERPDPRARGAQLYDDALREVQYAQRVWGDSPQLQATSAWIRHQQGLALKAEERFNALRGAITTMRRAYPQFLAAGGEPLPPDVLRIIFPLDYWPLITKYSDRTSSIRT